ncbi:hypothetical protein LTR08_000132 [Meristemomyces frigidus]|nr:hypothetical protein LTR08_000132 [Meristemomyces frigidus]
MTGGRQRRLIRPYPALNKSKTAPAALDPSRQGRTPRRQPDPFAASSVPAKSTTPNPQEDVRQAWGLNHEDMETMDSFIDPAAHATPAKQPAPVRIKRKATTPDAAPNLVAGDSSRLTHVTSTGEAHMVDVGTKPASRRVAVARAYVYFGNPEPFRLIFENSNKKGDVLGVARVAGIMAAKRTSDLIPLCHPLAISKVEVDVRLEIPGPHNPSIRKFGNVAVQALVECVGPTGVEMEALTAASGAALTVYDMCKAVDRDMRLGGIRVVYKSGGRSGEYCYDNWAVWKGRQWFEERGLEVPKPCLVAEASANAGSDAS